MVAYSISLALLLVYNLITSLLYTIQSAHFLSYTVYITDQCEYKN